jgi:hypothetical protein
VLVKGATERVVVHQGPWNALAIPSTRCSGEEQCPSPLKVIEYGSPGICRSVMRLVDDDHVEEVARRKVTLVVMDGRDRVRESHNHIAFGDLGPA